MASGNRAPVWQDYAMANIAKNPQFNGCKEILPGKLFQGSYADIRLAKRRHNTRHIVNCAWELYDDILREQGCHIKDQIIECRLKELDCEKLHPTVERTYQKVKLLLNAGLPVYICCVAGRNRSAVVTAYILHKYLNISEQEALDRVYRNPEIEGKICIAEYFLNQFLRVAFSDSPGETGGLLPSPTVTVLLAGN